METPASSDPNPQPAGRGRQFRVGAFSLVEIALSLGIMAFALLAVFGLMPLGMTTFKKTMDLSVGSQIAQRVIGDAQQSDFDALVTPPGAGTPATVAFAAQLRYFDDQGEEGLSSQPGMIYVVNTRVVPATSVPDVGGSSGSVRNVDIATVTVQVANNPGHKTLASDGTTKLWSATGAVPIATFSTFIARSSPNTSVTP